MDHVFHGLLTRKLSSQLFPNETQHLVIALRTFLTDTAWRDGAVLEQ